MSVNGVEAVYKDVIEPLESVSVQLTPTEKTTIVEYGPPNEIAGTLANSVLTSPSDDVQLIKSEPEKDGDRCASSFFSLPRAQGGLHCVTAWRVRGARCSVAHTRCVAAHVRAGRRVADAARRAAATCN